MSYQGSEEVRLRQSAMNMGFASRIQVLAPRCRIIVGFGTVP